MLEFDLLTDDQQSAIDRAYGHDNTLLIADMGAGKTVCALTAAAELLAEGVVKRILVVATLKICNNVWRSEHKLWSHLHHLSVAIATGDAAKRSAAIESDADIVCINFDNLAWFAEKYGAKKLFDGYIIDEVTKLKNAGGANFKKFRKHIKSFKWRLCMTGTPVSEDWVSLYGLCMMTDAGQALGTNKQKFLERYFYPTDYEQRNWAIRSELEAQALTKKISHLVHVLPDYRSELPDLDVIDVPVGMTLEVEMQYKELAKTSVLDLGGDAETVVAQNAAVLSGKLHQFTQGFLYGEDGETVNKMHRLKMSEISHLMRSGIGAPVVICYWFKEDLNRLKRMFPDAATLDDDANVERWNNGEIDILLLQPRSAGHGLNLAKGGYIMIFYSMVWSNDLNRQTVARLWRRGQTQNVKIYRIILEGSIDEVIAARVEDKQGHHERLLSHINSIIK